VFREAFGLGGVVATFGLALDLLGFALLLLRPAARRRATSPRLGGALSSDVPLTKTVVRAARGAVVAAREAA
jgi:hypothetical protein